jgi:hypothetical protein
LSWDRSIQRKFQPKGKHSSVAVVRNSDRRLVGVMIRTDQCDEEDPFIPEADAALQAAKITKYLLDRGAISVQAIGDNEPVKITLGSHCVSRNSVMVQEIKKIIPGWRHWLLIRQRDQNHLADHFTHVMAKGQGWEVTEERPTHNLRHQFIQELFHTRVQARVPQPSLPTPAPVEGDALEEALRFVREDIPESDLFIHNQQFDGPIPHGAADSVLRCLYEGVCMRKKEPRLPVLICRWITGNIPESG